MILCNDPQKPPVIILDGGALPFEPEVLELTIQTAIQKATDFFRAANLIGQIRLICVLCIPQREPMDLPAIMSREEYELLHNQLHHLQMIGCSDRARLQRCGKLLYRLYREFRHGDQPAFRDYLYAELVKIENDLAAHDLPPAVRTLEEKLEVHLKRACRYLAQRDILCDYCYSERMLYVRYRNLLEQNPQQVLEDIQTGVLCVLTEAVMHQAKLGIKADAE